MTHKMKSGRVKKSKAKQKLSEPFSLILRYVDAHIKNPWDAFEGHRVCGLDFDNITAIHIRSDNFVEVYGYKNGYFKKIEGKLVSEVVQE